MSALLNALSGVTGATIEMRRRGYASGLLRTRRCGARVVSIGNLTVGGTGKTTLVLHLAARSLAAGVELCVVGRRYRPGPGGLGDEELMYRRALGERRVRAGRSKRDLAFEAVAGGAALVLVDDGFSHWGLDRDLDIVLLDARDPWSGGRLLPAGRLREPLRSLERADVVVVTRLGEDGIASELEREIVRRAPSALLAGARHRVRGVYSLAGANVGVPGRVHVVTATGNPRAVEASAREAGCDVVTSSPYRDHHWFSDAEARRELERARAVRATVLMTAKDAVRWPAELTDACVLEVEWQWVRGGEAVERLVLAGVKR
jgi:tetraacyldisaccharide 4'-kinase